MLLKRLPLILATAVAALLTACNDGGIKEPPPRTPTPTPVPTAAATIAVRDNAFDPSPVNLNVGGKVTWDWAGSVNSHSIVASTGGTRELIDAEARTGSGTYTVTFEKAGTYDYQCGVHGVGMRGRIIVK